MTWLVTLCMTSLLVTHVTCQSSPIVVTPSGPIRGKVVPALGQDVLQFRNIPFAKPPMGRLRFRKPVPVEPWTDILDGTSFGPSCIQDTFLSGLSQLENKEVSEDCLQLNVYVPRAISRTEKKAVMVEIHSGGYVIGQAQAFDGSFLALKDVIVVTINYRLGVFGFLSTGDDVLRGNFGIWDMIEALKWVNKNIGAFGGDPEKVTLFGESARGFAVSTLACISSNRGLFHRVIAQSGSATGLMAISPDPLKVARNITHQLGCIPSLESTIDTRVVTDCLQKRSADDLILAQRSPLSDVRFRGFFTLQPDLAPVVDGELLHKKPIESLQDPRSDVSVFFRSLDFIAGTSSNEGALIALGSFYSYMERMKFNIMEEIPTAILCEVIGPAVARDMYGDESLSSDICMKYSTTDKLQQSINIVNLCSDSAFVVPTMQLLDFHARGRSQSNTYHYLYNQTLSFEYAVPTPVWMNAMGDSHGDELSFMSGPANQPDPSLTTNEARAFTDVLVSYWTNFAKTGNVSGGGLVPWERFTMDTREYLEIKYVPEQGRNLYETRMEFMMHKLPSIKAKNDFLSRKHSRKCKHSKLVLRFNFKYLP